MEKIKIVIVVSRLSSTTSRMGSTLDQQEKNNINNILKSSLIKKAKIRSAIDELDINSPAQHLWPSIRRMGVCAPKKTPRQLFVKLMISIFISHQMQHKIIHR